MSRTVTHTTSVLSAFTERPERNGQCERERVKRLKREATHVSRLHMTARVRGKVKVRSVDVEQSTRRDWDENREDN
jgi:hypothetical protein